MGVRIDSGDITYLTKKARQILDENGLQDCSIVISNSLDEHIIGDVLREGAQIDSFGVGERLITAKSEPVFGGVYKLAAVKKDDGEIVPKMKISENVEKITNPGFKKVYRFYGKDHGKALADVIALYDEPVPSEDNYEIFDPNNPWKRKVLHDYEVRELLVPIFEKGKKVYDCPDIKDIRNYCMKQVDTLWEESLRFDNPQTYKVDLSQKLWDLKNDLLNKYGK